MRRLGSGGTKVSLEAVEPRDPRELEFLDILPADAEDEERAGRAVRAELPLSKILQRAATDPVEGPSLGELFRTEDHREGVKSFLEKRPPRYVGR